MYNIHNHYSNIYSFAWHIIAEPSLIYLYPFGSSGPENIEVLGTEMNFRDEDIHDVNEIITEKHSRSGPVLICYDQEPLLCDYNQPLFDEIDKNYIPSKARYINFHQDIILLNTEKDSTDKSRILERNGFKDCYYFFHAFAAADWYRGYRHLSDLIAPSKRTLTKKFITFNRITSNARVYRSLLINELLKHGIIDQGYSSFSKDCPDGTTFDQELIKNASLYNIPEDLVRDTITNISSSTANFRIEYQPDEYIPNNSFHISAIKENMESFLHIVTETCYWGRKKHLTEKIFKPIVMRQPFVLVGCAHNLEYLKSYGFKTFDRWWDESYDEIEDDIERMHAIGNLLADICKRDLNQLTRILHEMEEVLEHNYKWFYSQEFLDNCWQELVTNLTQAITKKP